MEHEQRSPLTIDAAEIGSALDCPVGRTGGDVFEYTLRNEPVGISLRLAVDREKKAVSLYLRGASGFLGFVHIPGIKQVSIDHGKGEVTFIADGEPTSQLSVQHGGVFLVTRQQT